LLLFFVVVVFGLSLQVDLVPPLRQEKRLSLSQAEQDQVWNAAAAFQQQLAGTRRQSQIYTEAKEAELKQLRRATSLPFPSLF